MADGNRKMMSLGIRLKDHSSCEVIESESLPEDLREGILEVKSLHTDAEKRRSGSATRLLRDLCIEADNTGTTLLLMAKPYGDSSMSREQLQAWYRRFGFVEVDGTPGLMARPVRIVRQAVTKYVGKAVARALH